MGNPCSIPLKATNLGSSSPRRTFKAVVFPENHCGTCTFGISLWLKIGQNSILRDIIS